MVNPNKLALTVYDVLVGPFSGGGLTQEQWYTKVCLRLFIVRILTKQIFGDHLKHHDGIGWTIVRVDIIPDVSFPSSIKLVADDSSL